jgi:glycosyltransferase 2 family protein
MIVCGRLRAAGPAVGARVSASGIVVFFHRLVRITLSEAPDSPTPPARGRRALVLTLKIAISLGLLALLIVKSDAPRLWHYVRSASVAWLATALLIYFLMVVASAWRWGLLLGAQGVPVPARTLTGSFLVATFFNNFLPSNIGGDVIRIADTAKPARSKTLAATVVLIDRGVGLIGLVLLAAVAASAAGTGGVPQGPVPAFLLWIAFVCAGAAATPALFAPDLLMRLLAPLRRLHPEWVGARLERLSEVLGRFRQSPAALAGCFAGAVLVQVLLVAFYAAVAHAIGVNISPWHMAVVVPVSFLVQMLPVSLNGFGVREWTFSFYFARLGLPTEAALVISLLGAGLVMLFSLSGAAVYVVRGT